ncbi:NUDIX domain-containing protein [Streptomyces sp. M19]
MNRRLRVAAYAVCVRENKVLLARYVGQDGRHWTMPGGGIEHGEDPYDAVLREVTEETGYTVEIDRLLGIDSMRAIRAPTRPTPTAGGTSTGCASSTGPMSSAANCATRSTAPPTWPPGSTWTASRTSTASHSSTSRWPWTRRNRPRPYPTHPA